MLSIIAVAWILSPFALAVMYGKTKKKCKKQEMLLMHLYQQKRIDNLELHAAGVETPPLPPVPGMENPAIAAIPNPFSPPEPQQPISQTVLSEQIAPALQAQPVQLEKDAGLNLAARLAEKEREAALQPAAVQHPLEQARVPASPAPQFAYPPYAAEKQSVSPISVLLGVGVVLIIAAAFIFIRSAWGSMSDFTRLLTLTAGSALFFGTSVLARKVWSLERTSMAFFTLGAVFLPISVWGAGFFHLLGDTFSTDNPSALGALSFGAFTIIAGISVKIFRKQSWLIAALSGLSLTVWSSAIAAAKMFEDEDCAVSAFLCIIAAYAVIMTFGCWILRGKIGEKSYKTCFGFSLSVATLTASLMLISTATGMHSICAIAAFLTMAAFCAPNLTEWMKDYSAIPITILGLLGFSHVLHPLKNVYTLPYHYTGFPYLSLVCIACALCWYAMLGFKCLPDHMKRGSMFAAYVCSGLGVAAQFGALEAGRTLPVVLFAAAILLIVTILFAGKSPNTITKYLTAAQALAFCTTAGMLMPTPEAENLLVCVLCLVCLALLFVTKRFRTGVSDIACAVLCVLNAINLADSMEPVRWVCCTAVLIVLLCAAIFWLLTMEHGTAKLSQYFTAILTALTLAVTMGFAYEHILPSLRWEFIPAIWSCIAVAAGSAACFVSKSNFNAVRKLLAAALLIPAFCFICFSPVTDLRKDSIPFLLIGCAAAAMLWVLFVKRESRPLSCAAFGMALLLLSSAAGHAVTFYVDHETLTFTACILGSLPVLAAALIAIGVSKEMVSFRGSESVCDVMRIAAPVSALIMACFLFTVDNQDLASFFFVYLFGFIVVSWLVSKPKSIIMPSVSVLSLILMLECVRVHITSEDPENALPLLLFMIVMELLFPYLGKVLRETESPADGMLRSFSLTSVGAALPIWLGAIAGGLSDINYSGYAEKWLVFFVPVLFAGFLLHFIPEVTDTAARKKLLTAASALLMIACWMQPLFNVKDTYLEGKLHLLPLIAFGIVIRRLYGKETGSSFLFGIGIYTMLRLAGAAISSEEAADLLTVLGTALAIFIGSFYVKQKKWFMLGGVSLVILAVYLHMKISHGAFWWIYLLLAGLLLIVIAAANETLKQRGDSLKEKAGRLWVDWKW